MGLRARHKLYLNFVVDCLLMATSHWNMSMFMKLKTYYWHDYNEWLFRQTNVNDEMYFSDAWLVSNF